jgi:hypothetical protein
LLTRRGFAINWLVVAMLTPGFNRMKKHRADPFGRAGPVTYP